MGRGLRGTNCAIVSGGVLGVGSGRAMGRGTDRHRFAERSGGGVMWIWLSWVVGFGAGVDVAEVQLQQTSLELVSSRGGRKFDLDHLHASGI